MFVFKSCCRFSRGEHVPNTTELPFGDLELLQSNIMPGVEHRWTLGAKARMRCNGQWYYEVTLGDDFGEWAFPQIGWATDLFVEQCYGKYGIGNCYESLGVCGVRHKIWHLDEETFQWPRQWQAGDVIGLAIDIDDRTVRFSLNGNWISRVSTFTDWTNGRSFFPALSILGSFTMALTRSIWRYSPPSCSYLSWSDSGQFEYKIRFGSVRVPILTSDGTESYTTLPLPLFRFLFHVDKHCCSRTIVDNHEVEILYSWRCQCGHWYDPSLDDSHGRAFHDLPAEWPCPNCGQRFARNWHVVDLTRLDQSPGLRSQASPQPNQYRSRPPPPTPSQDWSSPRTYAFTSSTCTPRSHDDLETSSDGDSFSALSPDRTEERPEFDVFHALLPQRNWKCDNCDENLEWGEDDSLWCRTCNVIVQWPVWQPGDDVGSIPTEIQQREAQSSLRIPCSASDSEVADDFFFTASTLESPRESPMLTTMLKPNVDAYNSKWVFGSIADEYGSLRSMSYMHRSGLHRETSPTRPGHRACGGHCGQWWTVPDARYLAT